jgi:phosphate transport system substrate-binding protein
MKKLTLLFSLLPFAALAGNLTVKGSDTMVVMTQKLAEEFMKKNPAAKLQVTGGGSGTGIAALINGTTDIATASRPMKDEEKGKLKAQPVEIPIAKDGVTFFVNEKNPGQSLTPDQLKSIYVGDVTNWKDVGGPNAPIVVYSRENNSGTYVFVKEHLLKNEDYAAAAQTLPGTAAVVNAVSKEKNGIGFGGIAYGKGVKALRVKVGAEEIVGDEATIKSGKYPLSRPLYFYLKEAPKGDAKTFVDYCLSGEGQKVVAEAGFFSIK